MIIYPNQFEQVFREEMTPFVDAKILGYKLEHQVLHGQELERGIIDILEGMENPGSAAGQARHPTWEAGWGENLKDFDPACAGPELARPRYFNKHPLVRWHKQLCRAISPDYEYNMLATIQYWLFEKWLKEWPTVYEFGCGTGHNLFRVREVNPCAKLVGLDWAESAVKFINLQAKHGADRANSMEAHRFDFFNPGPLHLDPHAGVYTVAALEQVGSAFDRFLDLMLTERPAVVVHVEPLEEFLDPTRLLDYLSLAYFKKRRYLTGYVKRLRQLQTEGKIQILQETRTHIGSKFIEGYSVVVWKPL